MVWISVALLLVAYIPGALAYRLPVADRPRRAALPADERAFWAIVISIAFSSIVALILAALERYSFERLLAVDAGCSLAMLLVWRRRLGFGGTAPRPGWALAIPLVLVVSGLWQFFPSSEYVIGGKDPGVYINEGVAIAERGSLLVHDAVVAAVPPASREMFFPPYSGQPYYSLRFMGFFLLDPDAGTVIVQFPHLYPVWVAIGYGLNGVTGARQVIGWWSILGLLAVYFAGARLIGRAAAAAATALLAVSVLQIWFARYPNSEMPMQALVFAALLAFARSHVDGDHFFAWVAGVLLGLLIFLRVDAVLAIAAVAIAAGLLMTQRRMPQASFVVALGVTLVAGWFYLTGVMKPYAARPLGFVANLRPFHLALLGGAAACLAALVLAARRRPVAAAIRTWVPRAFAVAITCAAGYAYFLRQAGGRLAAPDAAAFRTFAWYLPPEGLAVAVLGCAAVAWRRFWRDPALLVTVAVFAFFFFYKTQITREHFWAARRFVAVIYPAALLMMSAAALFAVWPRPPEGGAAPPPLRSVARRFWSVGLAVVFLGFVGWRLVTASRPILNHVEYAGVISKLESLARHFGGDDLVLVEPRYSSDMHVLALPLAYVYGRNVLVLNTPRPDKARFRGFLEWARTRYRHVYFVGGGGADLLSRSISAQPVFGDRFQIPEYESRLNAYPTGVRFKEFDYSVYRLLPGTAPEPFRSLDIGAADDLNIWRFHAKERMETTSFRWSRDASYIALPNLPSSVRSVTLWMGDGGRLPGLPPARVTLYLDDQLLGEVTVVGGFQPHRFAIPSELASRVGAKDDPAVLRLVCNTWNPQKALGVADSRDVGVMVDRVEVQ